MLRRFSLVLGTQIQLTDGGVLITKVSWLYTEVTDSKETSGTPLLLQIVVLNGYWRNSSGSFEHDAKSQYDATRMRFGSIIHFTHLGIQRQPKV